MRIIYLSILFLLISFFSISQTTCWRGAQQNGKFTDTGLLTQWPEGGPELLLKVEGIGKGFSSVIATDRYLFATGMVDTLDYLTCVTMDGKIKWKVAYGRSWIKSYPDTRGSATIDAERAYVISGTGELVCIRVENGEIIWKVNVDKDYNADWHNWGVSETPLLVGNLVLCTPGGKTTSVVAFDKMNGNMVWKSESVGGLRSYVSPTLFGYKQYSFILAATATHLIALDPATGNIAWKYPYYNKEKWDDQTGLIWANTPIFKGRDIFLTMGYDYHNVMLQMNEEGTAVTEKWSNQVLDNHHHGVVEQDGYIYGSNWENNSKGKWVCMDWETGEVKYETAWLTKGAIISDEGLLYLLEEKSGTVALVKPDPSGFQLISSFKLSGGTGPYWSHPFIANGKLYLRHGDLLFVYNLRKQG